MMPPTAADQEVIRSFPCYSGPGTPGFITDFLGIKTRCAYIAHNDQAGGVVEGYPIPGGYHATGLEWAGTLRAARDAGETVVAVELGAGWGPWLVTIAKAAALRGAKRFHLVAVEGSRHHLEYLLTHFRDNGLDPADHTILHGIAAPTDGTAEFPVLADPAADWGTAAVLGEADRGAAPTETLRAYSLDTLLQPYYRVDLVHIDIQGHEVAVVTAARAVLGEKVKRLVIGTHGRSIEEQLLNELAANGWVLEAEEPCLYRQTEAGMQLLLDGCQVWRNRGLTRG
jgi:FkbM family methyltransferase